jgi:hypothetical protein
MRMSMVAGGVDRRAHLVDPGGAARRGLVLDHADRLDLMGEIGPQRGLDGVRVRPPAPIAADHLRLQA